MVKLSQGVQFVASVEGGRGMLSRRKKKEKKKKKKKGRKEKKRGTKIGNNKQEIKK